MRQDIDRSFFVRAVVPGGGAARDVDVVVTFRLGVPPQVQRIVAEVRRVIRRRRPPRDAIRRRCAAVRTPIFARTCVITSAIAFPATGRGNSSGSARG